MAGDYNHNGVVDAADYTVWRDTLGSTTNLQADGDGSGVVDQDDYLIWKATFGNTAAGSGAGAKASAVPEPGSALLLLIGVLTFVGVKAGQRVGEVRFRLHSQSLSSAYSIAG
jgi:hypothetical protein